jgi:hypothetical protein
MAGDFWDVLQWRESKNGKAWAVKLGSAKQKDDGGFWVDLTAYPIPTLDDRGQLRCSFTIQPPKGEYKPKAQQAEDEGNIPF